MILGSIVYRMVVAFALQVRWLESSDLKLITAIIVIIALTVPMIRGSIRQKNLARKRSEELQLSSASGGRSDA